MNKRRNKILIILFIYTAAFFLTNNTTLAMYRDTLNQILGINVIDDASEYTIQFDSEGGTPVDSITKNKNEPIGELPVPYKEGYALVGWWDEELDVQVTEETLVTSSKTYHAHWKAYVCKKATVLHTETCTRSDNNGCKGAGYTETGSQGTTTITYGAIPTQDDPISGFAYDCDVNGDGEYDSDTERFYYLRTKDDKAVLISHTNYLGTEQGTGGEFGYNAALDALPPTTQWSNLDVTFNDKAARLVTYEDLSIAQTNLIGTGKLDKCLYVYENTRFYNENGGKTALWIDIYNDSYTRIMSTTRTVETGKLESSKNGSRPVIEVPLKYLEKSSVFTITFDTDTEQIINPITKNFGEELGELPTPSKDGATFEGWYDIATGNKVNEHTTVTGDMNLKAHYTKIICKTATLLHSSGTTKFGTIPNSTTLQPGFAYDCDVNNDDVYDKDTERFYYLRTDSSNNAVLVYYNNVSEGAPVCGADGVLYNTDRLSYLPPTRAYQELPDSSVWSAVELHNLPRQIVNQNGDMKAYHGEATQTFDYPNKSSRFATTQELVEACGIADVTETMTNCEYLLENTRKYDSNCRSNWQLETPYGINGSTNDNKIYRVQNDNKISFSDLGTTDRGFSAVRPVIEVPIDFIQEYDPTPAATHRVSFNTHEGSPVADMEVNHGEAIGELPTTLRSGYNFHGWFTDETYSIEVTSNTLVTSDMELHAKWIAENMVAEIGNTPYETLQAAVTAADTTGIKTTIKLLKDTTELITVSGKRNIVLNLNRKTLSNVEGKNVIILNNTSQLELTNGVITSLADQGIVNVENGTTLIVNGATLLQNGGRQVIYNNGGTTYIKGTSTLASVASGRAAIHNKENGTVYIESGTVESNGTYAVYNEKGTLEIGVKDGNVDKTTPIIQGKTYGVIANTSYPYKFYNGTIKGQTYATGKTSNTGNTPTVTKDENETMISEIELYSEKVNSTEMQSSTTYKILYLESTSEKYIITLDPRGGVISDTTIEVIPGEEVGAIPEVSKGIYTFDGWYDLDTDEEVNAHTIPTKSTTYYAKWKYVPNPDVVTFRTTNDAQKVYYEKIDEWKLDKNNFPVWNYDETTNPTVMRTNFDNNNCMCADGQCTSSGTVHCDKPKGYNTGVGGDVNVYLYNESTSTKITPKVTYAKGNNGIIYNLIPDKVYYWELATDPDVHGLVKFTGERRLIDAGDVLNVRDLGGLPVDQDNDGTIDGHLKYEKLFRGIKLNSASSVTELDNLGVTKELDLREANSDANRLSNYQRIEIQNYYINPNTTSSQELQYYNWTRTAVKQVMQDITNETDPQSIYFHCRIGTDRTGTLAYILEGLLGVPEEDRVQDYELSFFYGLVRIHRYHDEKPGSSVGTGKERFVYMHDFMPTNEDIYNWYMAGTTEDERQNDINLINAFRQAMIE